MLGTLVTPDQLGSSPSSDPYGTSPMDLRLPSISSRQLQTPSDQISFISFEDDVPSRRGSDSTKEQTTNARWTDKIRQSMGKRSNSSKDVTKVVDDQSFFDFRKDTGWKTHKASVSTPTRQTFDDTAVAQQPRKLSGEEGGKSWGKKKSQVRV